MEHLKDNTPEYVITDAFREYDTNGNSYLEFNEFSKLARA